jgi:hypothetical protein
MQFFASVSITSTASLSTCTTCHCSPLLSLSQTEVSGNGGAVNGVAVNGSARETRPLVLSGGIRLHGAMIESIQQNAGLIGWLTAASAAMLIGSAIVVPWIVVQIPRDFFAEDRRPTSRFAFEHPILRVAFFVLRNLLGMLILLVGIAMLVLPGQGLLTVAVALIILEFPGKYQLERRIIRIGPLLNSINWLREKSNVPPLRMDRE